MSKYTVRLNVNGADVSAEVDTFAAWQRAIESLIPLSKPVPVPVPVPVPEPEPEPFLDAAGKAFGIKSVLAYHHPGGRIFIVSISQTRRTPSTGQWAVWVTDNNGSRYGLEGIMYKPTKGLFKLEASMAEYARSV
jgi:hypothetical protein